MTHSFCLGHRYIELFAANDGQGGPVRRGGGGGRGFAGKGAGGGRGGGAGAAAGDGSDRNGN